MTDITELAQRNELLIANGQQTADLLRHLADNEIDSDYFAVASECESYGKETEAELSITEFALRAARYVDELVEALEKAQRANAAQDDHINQQQDRIESLEKKNAELGKYAGGLESFRTAYMEWSDKTDWVQTDKRFDFLKPWGKHRADVLKAYIEHLESRAVTFKLPSTPEPSAFAPWVAKAFYQFHKDTVKSCVAVFSDACRAAGIKVEAE
ncbi:hypothetical protein [Klebsiella pneumoniae]|uniref:hypothetical protein n=1 Tax=Klebsiella pneumoniae TaxID=573 RepID=UPI00215B65C4|nr:hypothetical protein [Klebsiella pneumoniae]